MIARELVVPWSKARMYFMARGLRNGRAIASLRWVSLLPSTPCLMKGLERGSMSRSMSVLPHCCESQTRAPLPCGLPLATTRSGVVNCSTVPPQTPPSQSAEDYLERIHELIEEKGYARVVDIASSL